MIVEPEAARAIRLERDVERLRAALAEAVAYLERLPVVPATAHLVRRLSEQLTPSPPAAIAPAGKIPTRFEVSGFMGVLHVAALAMTLGESGVIVHSSVAGISDGLPLPAEHRHRVAAAQMDDLLLFLHGARAALKQKKGTRE